MLRRTSEGAAVIQVEGKNVLLSGHRRLNHPGRNAVAHDDVAGDEAANLTSLAVRPKDEGAQREAIPDLQLQRRRDVLPVFLTRRLFLIPDARVKEQRHLGVLTKVKAIEVHEGEQQRLQRVVA